MSPPKSPSKPLNAYRMTATFKNFAYKLSSSLSSSSVPTLKNDDGSFGKAKKTEDLFPTTDPTTGPTGPELVCTSSSCGLAYRIDDGVPVLLVDEARRPA